MNKHIEVAVRYLMVAVIAGGFYVAFGFAGLFAIVIFELSDISRKLDNLARLRESKFTALLLSLVCALSLYFAPYRIRANHILPPEYRQDAPYLSLCNHSGCPPVMRTTALEQSQ